MNKPEYGTPISLPIYPRGRTTDPKRFPATWGAVMVSGLAALPPGDRIHIEYRMGDTMLAVDNLIRRISRIIGHMRMLLGNGRCAPTLMGISR